MLATVEAKKSALESGDLSPIQPKLTIPSLKIEKLNA